MVKIEIELNEVIKKTDNQSRQLAKKVLANQMIADMDKFVPYKLGDLRGSVGLANNDTIEYRTKYAKAQFYGGTVNPPRTFRKYTTPQTGKRWDLKAKSLYMDSWKEIYRKGLGL